MQKKLYEFWWGQSELMDPISVLVSSSGVASAVNIIKSLKIQKELRLTIIATDIDPLAAGLYLADHHYLSPPINEIDNYIQFLIQICLKHNIKVFFPCFSKELLIIANNLNLFIQNGIHVHISSRKTIESCNDKIIASDIVRSLCVPVPRTITHPEEKDLPLFSKPREGSSSRDTFIIEDLIMLQYLKSKSDVHFFQEYIQGVEYTVDVLCDENSEVLFSGPRIRIATKSGQSIKSVTVHSSLLNEYVSKICKRLEIIGGCNFQFIERDGEYFFIEINPRFAAGGLMLTTHAGANLPLAALKLMLGIPFDHGELKHTENIVMSRYWEEVFLENYNEKDKNSVYWNSRNK